MIIKFNHLEKLRRERTVYTAGSFDLLHRGHVEYLRYIKNKFPRHKLVVGLLPDKRVSFKKGTGRPIIPQNNRLYLIDAVKYVDYAFICPIYKNGCDATFMILKKLRPSFVVFPQKKYKKIKNKFMETNSKLVIRNKFTKRPSTSQIIEKIKRLRIKNR